MINRYNDFIFESLMLESILVYSADFKELLKQIDSPVAKTLLDIESQDLTLANNYIDITKNKEEISFIPDRKAQEILKPEFLKKIVYYVGSGGLLKHSESNREMFDMLEYEPIGDKSYQPNSDEKGEVQKRATSTTSGKTYLKVKFPGGISVVDEQKIRYEDAQKLPFLLNRQPIRIGRGVGAILRAAKATYPDAQIEEFVNKYKTEFDKLNDVFKQFEIVKGADIAKWYKEENYQHQSDSSPIGTLGKSCMRQKPSRFFDIYVQNPDVCSLLILKTEDGKKLRARALVWELQSPPGITYMDRTYTHSDADFDLFRQYAEKKGWYRRPTNDYNNSQEMIDPNGKKVDMGHLEVKVDNEDYLYYPYVDTIRHYNSYKGILSTKKIKGTTIELDDTGGGYSGRYECDFCYGDGRTDCPECDGNGEKGCYNCDGDGEVSCGECGGDGGLHCHTCDGDGDVECPTCDGEGVDEEGEECGSCEGNCRISCEDCGAKGTRECEECSGGGYEECGDCDGSGRYECDFCYGDGRVDCPECG